MSITVVCPRCAARHEVPDSAAGAKGKCRACGEVIQVPAAVPGAGNGAGGQGPLARSGGLSAASAATESQTIARAEPVAAAMLAYESARNRPRMAPQAGSPQLSEPVWVGFLDARVTSLGESLNGAFFNANARVLFQMGNWVLLALAILTAGLGIWSAVDNREGQAAAAGIGLALGLVLLQYVSIKAINAGNAAVASSPSELAPTAFLKCCALLSVALAILSLVYGVTLSVHERQFAPLWQGLALAVFFTYLVSLATNPTLVNVWIAEPSSPGMEAVGIISFLLKSMLRLSPILYGSWLLLALLDILLAVYEYNSRPPEGALFGRRVLLQIRLAGAGMTVLAALLAPVVTYLFFLLYHLVVDVLRSLLVLPGRMGERQDEPIVGPAQ